MTQQPTTNPRGIAAGALVALVFGYMAWDGWPAGDWRSLAAVPAALLAILGLVSAIGAAQHAPRDGRGRRLR